MSDAEDKATPEPFHWHSISIDRLKTKTPSFFGMVIPPEFFPTIGLVATGWGQFEILFDNFLAALVKAQSFTGPTALSFRKRRKLFRDLTAQALTSLPTITTALNSILDDSESIYIRRNLVVHGHQSAYLSTEMRNGKSVQIVSLLCVGRLNGDELRQTFTWDALDDLFYEIGHLSGRLHAVSTAAPPLSSHDKSLLLSFLKSNHPTYPNPHMLPPQQPASKA